MGHPVSGIEIHNNKSNFNLILILRINIDENMVEFITRTTT